jgi:hypothetical protein
MTGHGKLHAVTGHITGLLFRRSCALALGLVVQAASWPWGNKDKKPSSRPVGVCQRAGAWLRVSKSREGCWGKWPRLVFPWQLAPQGQA